jgi:hypothetical protein
MSSEIEIDDNDILEANERMSGNVVEKEKSTSGDVALEILALLFIIGIILYFDEWTKKKDGKVTYKDDEGNTKEIDTEISFEEIDLALEILKSGNE